MTEKTKLFVPRFPCLEAFGLAEPSDEELTGFVRSALADGDPCGAGLALTRMQHPELRSAMTVHLQRFVDAHAPAFGEIWPEVVKTAKKSSILNRRPYTTLDGLDVANICRMILECVKVVEQHPQLKFAGRYVKAQWRFDGRAQNPGFRLRKPLPFIFWQVQAGERGAPVKVHLLNYRSEQDLSDLRFLPAAMNKHPGILGPNLLQYGWNIEGLYAPPPSGASRAMWAQLENSHRLAAGVPPEDPIAKVLIPLNPVFDSSDPVLTGWLP